MPIKFKIVLLIPIAYLLSFNIKAQDKTTDITIGFSYGFGTQQSFPFNSKDYSYKPQSFKAIATYTFKNTSKWKFEAFFEPAIYISKHQLLNKYYVKPSEYRNYLELRDIYMQEKTINEYALGFGIIVNYKLLNSVNIHALGSIGPMISNTSTERLDKGFAFSDVVALGLSFNTSSIIFDIRAGLRHVSNLSFNETNSGHNSSFLEFGCRFTL